MPSNDRNGPPRPKGARPTEAPRPRPSDRPRTPRHATKDDAGPEVVQPRSSDDLEMIPVAKEGEHEDLAPPPPPGSTQFFEVDRPPPFVNETKPTKKEQEVSQRAALFTPGRNRTPEPEPPPEPEPRRRSRVPRPSLLPPVAAPPGPGSAPAQGPTAAPPTPATEPPSGLGIKGPIASGPGAAAKAPPPEPAPPQDPADRSVSYRFYVVMLGLMALTASAIVLTISVIAAVVIFSPGDDPAPPPEPAPIIEPAPTPTPILAPAPDVVVEPPPEVEAPVPSKTAPLTLRLAPGSPKFVSLRIDCEEPPFKSRKTFEGGQVVVPDVPRKSCTASFLGGLPARTKVRGGQSLTCRFDGANAICN